MKPRLNHILVLPFLLAAGALLLLPAATIPPHAAMGGALAIAAVGFWATASLPEHMTALIFFLVAMVFGVAESQAVFSGFSAGAFWLLFGGMILGTAVGRTGLGARLARSMARRMGVSYTGVLAGVVFVALALSFLMPSATGRAVLLIPVAVSLAAAFGFEPGSRGGTGIAMAAALGAVIPGFGILPANVPNLVMAGGADTLYDIRLTYGEFLLLHFPVLGLCKAFAIIAVVRTMFPDVMPDRPAGEEDLGPLSRNEVHLALILAGALALWATDFAHGISPAWVALGGGILCLMPPISLIPAEKIGEAVQLRPLIYISGVLSLGAVVTSTGFANEMAAAFLSVAGLEPGGGVANIATVAGAQIVTSVLGTAPTVPAVWTPLAGQLADAMGLPVKTVLMTQVLAYSTVILPYQVPPVVVALQLAHVPTRNAIRAVLALAAVTLLILLPLDLLWWSLLGVTGG